MLLSACFAPSIRTPDHIVLAEDLGFARAWTYDSPALFADPWMILALAAERTSKIGLGPGVLVPSLRHVVVNAAAILTLEALAPGRVAIAVGAGYTGRVPLGHPRAMPWRAVRSYVEALQRLLAGQDAQLDGAALALLHGVEHGAPRPSNIQILVAAEGPKGCEVAMDLGGAIFTTEKGLDDAKLAAPWTSVIDYAMVLGDDEGTEVEEEIIDVMGWAAALVYHGAYERGVSEHLPEGARWKASADAVPAHRRHLAVHEGHMTALNAHDREVSARALRSVLPAVATIGDREVIAGHLRALAARGVQEVAIHIPVGFEETQLRRLAAAAADVVATSSAGAAKDGRP